MQLKEDGLLRFCYETDIGTGSFEDMVRRIKWNYEAKLDKKPHDGCPVSICGPFGDRGYIEPFLDFTNYVQHGCDHNLEGNFPLPSLTKKRSTFTCYFNQAICSTYLSLAGRGEEVATDPWLLEETDSWLDSVVDTVLLELGDLLEEDKVNFCCNYLTAVNRSESPAVLELTAKLSDDQFFAHSGPKMSVVRGEVDYDHLPWPWISLPPSNALTMGVAHWNKNSDARADDCASSSTTIITSSSPSSQSSPLVMSPPSPSQNCPRLIPVLSPLGVHRAEGGERILSGPGVDHLNLVQLVGNPAHRLQPKLVQSWRRSPAFVQWLSQWDAFVGGSL